MVRLRSKPCPSAGRSSARGGEGAKRATAPTLPDGAGARRWAPRRRPRPATPPPSERGAKGHGHIVRAKAAAPDITSAVDRVIDKLEHRVSRLKGKLVNRSHPRRNGSVDSEGHNYTQGDDDADGEKGQPRIVKTKQFSIKPM